MQENIVEKHGREYVWDAIRILEDGLSIGCIDISIIPDRIEMDVVKEALRLFKNKYKFNQGADK